MSHARFAKSKAIIILMPHTPSTERSHASDAVRAAAMEHTHNSGFDLIVCVMSERNHLCIYSLHCSEESVVSRFARDLLASGALSGLLGERCSFPWYLLDHGPNMQTVCCARGDFLHGGCGRL